MHTKGKRKMSVQTGRLFSEQKTLHVDESVEALEIDRSTTSQDRVVFVLYEARDGQKTYCLKITPKGITLV